MPTSQRIWDWVNVSLIDKMRKRFLLGDYPTRPDNMTLLKTITPVTEVSELLREAKLASSTQDLSGAGTTVMFTVPSGKRWRLVMYRKSQTTGTRSVQVYDGTTPVPLTTVAAGESLYQGGGNDWLPEGWVIRSQDTGNGGDAARTDYIWYLEENAFEGT